MLDRAVRDGDRQVRLAASGLAVQDQGAAVGHEVGPEIRAQQRRPELGLQREVEVVDRLEVGEMRAAREPLQPGLCAMRHFFGDEQRQKVPIGPLLLLGARDCVGMDPTHVGQVEPLEQRVEF